MSHLSGSFVGLGALPQVVSALALTQSRVRVTFSEDMAPGAPLSDPGNYTVTEDPGNAARVATAVSVESPTTVVLTLDGPLDPGTDNYAVTVDPAVEDLAGNGIDPAADTADFSGPSTDLSIVLASPLNSNTIRVYFSREPRHISPLGSRDALNRTLWTLQLLAPGSALVEEPEIERVENPLQQGAYLVGLGIPYPEAWSVDVRTARRLADTRSVFLIIGSAAIASQDGAVTLAPDPGDRATLRGVIEARGRRPARPGQHREERRDYRYDTYRGVILLDARRDLDTHSGLSALEKRILRRLMSSPGGFVHLPDYGAGLKVKELYNPTRRAELQASVRAQVLEEEEVERASVDVQFAGGVVFVLISAVTREGQVRISLRGDGERLTTVV